MDHKDYQCSITAPISPEDAYRDIAKVDAWWAKNFKGSASSNGDTFTVTFGTTWVDFEIAEAVPGKKVVWQVTDCYLPWLNDKTEWNGTKVVWTITEVDGQTRTDMTHVGLHPGVECYGNCETGWNGHIAGSLQRLMKEGAGEPA